MVRSAYLSIVAYLSLGVAFAQSGGGGGGVLEALRDLFLPQVPLEVRFERVVQDWSGRFPWSVYVALRDLRLSGEVSPFEWSGSIGPIPLGDGVVNDVLGWIRAGMGWLMGLALIVWLTNRVAPQLRL